MITLHEAIDIPTPFEKLVAWSENFEEEFVKWSPYHLECSLYDKSLAVGSKVRFYEIVAGLDYDVTGTIIESEADLDHFRYVFLSNFKGAVITFAGRRTPDGCRFSHTEEFGLRTPVIGPLLNFLIFKVIARKKADWNLVRSDMILDNELLRDILVEGRYPARIPVDELKKGTPIKKGE
ncbi:MAG: hypothetical protein ACTTKS_02625 [Bulleidia sp.]